MVQVTVYSGAQRRREWNDDEKLAILGQAFAPGVNVSEVGRQLDIAASLIYRWRKRFAARGCAAFSPVLITANPPPPPASTLSTPALSVPSAMRASEGVGCNPHVAMMVTARGVRVEVMDDAAPDLITAMLGVLAQ
jgi:transposase